MRTAIVPALRKQNGNELLLLLEDNSMKKIMTLLVTLLLAFAAGSYPVNAEGPRRTTGNGYSYGNLTHNGKTYSYSHSFVRSGNQLGACFTSAPYVTRQHSSGKAVFSTYNFGNTTNNSSARTVITAGTSYAYYAVCQYGDAQVEKIISGTASVTVLTNPAFRSNISVSY